MRLLLTILSVLLALNISACDASSESTSTGSVANGAVPSMKMTCGTNACLR